MIIDARTGARGKLFDADNVEIMGAVACNLETGHVQHYAKNDKGEYETILGHLVLETFQRKAPLRFVPDMAEAGDVAVAELKFTVTDGKGPTYQ